MRLWRAIRNHRKTYPNYITEQQQSNYQQNISNNNNNNSEILDELNRNEINRNIHGLMVNRLIGGGGGGVGSSRRNSLGTTSNIINNNINPSVPEITVQSSSTGGSNCNSFDSAATASSEDYESCNGGHMCWWGNGVLVLMVKMPENFTKKIKNLDWFYKFFIILILHTRYTSTPFIIIN